jgi:hypothetical protein
VALSLQCRDGELNFGTLPLRFESSLDFLGLGFLRLPLQGFAQAEE